MYNHSLNLGLGLGLGADDVDASVPKEVIRQRVIGASTLNHFITNDTALEEPRYPSTIRKCVSVDWF